MNDDSASDSSDRRHYVVAIGASAGGLAAIKELLAELPTDLDAPVVIAVHSEPESKLKEALNLWDSRSIKSVEDGEILERSMIYIVPPAKHAFFQGGRFRLSNLVQDSGFRPSIDALFMTLAAEYGDRAIAVVLSGLLSDGMRGAQVIHDMGGHTIVQDPEDALYPSMPASVIRADHPKAVRTAPELGAWIASVVGTTA